MLSQPEREEIAKADKIHQIIWLAMIVSLVLYVGIALGLIEGEPADNIGMMTIVFAGLSLVVLLTIPLVRSMILQRRLPDADLESLIKQQRTVMIISLALAEAVGLFGFILYVLGQDAMTLAVFMGVALLAQLNVRPSRTALEAFVTETRRGR